VALRNSHLPDADARRRAGRDAREKAPRSSLAYLADRPDAFDPIGVLEQQGAGRLRPLLAIRYQRMIESPFAFFRGAAALQSADLAQGNSSGLEVQICGDAHLLNFGIYSSPERRLVFDINDFDETTVGPFEWDVMRLGASLVIAAASLNFTPQEQEQTAVAAVRAYREAIRQFALQPVMSIWYSALDLESIVEELRDHFTDEAMRQVNGLVARAQARTSARAFDKLVTFVDGVPRINYDPPLLIPIDQIAEMGGVESVSTLLEDILKGYADSLSFEHRVLLSQFVPVDGALKVVGVGSVGTRCFIMLLLGRDSNDPLFLQIKEASSSVIDVALDRQHPTTGGERVVNGQRLMQAVSDLYLGWQPMVGPDGIERSYYVRQLYDNKASVNVEQLTPMTMGAYARVCGWTLARAHACGGKPIEIAGYLGKSDTFDEAIASYALSYQHRNALDHHALQVAVNSGRITASDEIDLAGEAVERRAVAAALPEETELTTRDPAADPVDS
jgi:uncharacterized protein (DUF2252 family)